MSIFESNLAIIYGLCGCLLSLYMSCTPADCPICLTEFSANNQDVTVVRCCKNMFHTTCYIKCIISKKECPLCRGDPSSDGDVELHINSTVVAMYVHNEHGRFCMKYKLYLLTAFGICVLLGLAAVVSCLIIDADRSRGDQ